MLNGVVSKYHHQHWQIAPVSLCLPENKDSSLSLPFWPQSCMPYISPSQAQLSSMHFSYQKDDAWCPPPFLRSCSWKLLVQPDDNFSIFSRNSGGEDLSSSIFFTVSMFKISDNLLKGTLALTVSEWKEISSHLPELSMGRLVPHPNKLHGSASSGEFTWWPLSQFHPLLPLNEEMWVLLALQWLLSVILRKENKRERFKGEMDYYFVVYSFNWHIQALGFYFFSMQRGKEIQRFAYGWTAKKNMLDEKRMKKKNGSRYSQVLTVTKSSPRRLPIA